MLCRLRGLSKIVAWRTYAQLGTRRSCQTYFVKWRQCGIGSGHSRTEAGMSVSVIVPQTTKPLVIQKLESLGASVTVHGKNWNEADTLARELVAADDTAKYVSPYDNPLLWTGHSTIVDEIIKEIPIPIGAIVVSVGGGGLLCGILEGCQRHGVTPKVIAAETQGASSFGQSWEKGELVTLPGIDSIATSLGATSVTPVALERAKAHKGEFDTAICTDAEAIEACLQFSRDHRMLVEPACGLGWQWLTASDFEIISSRRFLGQ